MYTSMLVSMNLIEFSNLFLVEISLESILKMYFSLETSIPAFRESAISFS
jgi:hypothetical protein